MSNQYWQRRFLMDKARVINDAESYLQTNTQVLFTKAAKEINETIERFYKKYADQNGITLAEARRTISAADFQKIDWDGMIQFTLATDQNLQEKRDKLPGDVVARIERQHESYERLLAAYTKKGEITREELLRAEIDKSLLELYDANQINIYDYMAHEYEDSYYRSTYNVQQAVGFGKNFTALNHNAINKAILNEYARSNFSETIYQHCYHFSVDLRDNLVIGMIRGENLDRMASRIHRRMNVALSAAKRLVRTETAYVYEQATKDSYEECEIEKYEFLATLDNRTSAICRELDGKIFEVKDAAAGVNYPPMHPNCRSTTVCAFDDDVPTKRLAKDSKGKYYEVPSDMKYEDWRQKYVVNGMEHAKPNEDDDQELNILSFGSNIKCGIDDMKDFFQMEDYLSKTYHATVDPDVVKLNYQAVQQAVHEMEEVFTEFPALKDTFAGLNTHYRGTASMSPAGELCFNPDSYINPVKNLSGDGYHEAGHLMELCLIRKDHPSASIDKIMDIYNSGKYADNIVETAYRRTGSTKSILERRMEISKYSMLDNSETMADAIKNYMQNKGNSAILSRQIYKVLKEVINGK